MPARFDVTDGELAYRKATGIDRWDEVWDGVWYMTPPPSFEHQRIVDMLIRYLGPLLETSERGVLVSGIGVSTDTKGWVNYRVPDLTFIVRGREYIACEDGVRAAGPDAVIEIRSPADDTYEKLPFYAAIGTREVVIVDRDTKAVEIRRLIAGGLTSAEPDADGWLLAETMSVRFRRIDAQPPRLRIEDAVDPAASVEI
jgi:Uma2 family endonuclease